MNSKQLLLSRNNIKFILGLKMNVGYRNKTIKIEITTLVI